MLKFSFFLKYNVIIIDFFSFIEGITDVIIYQPTEDGDKLKNRGFCFLDFDSHKSAATARKKLLNTRLRVI